ncbi:hypothetical protein [Saccharopolyspora griseoalba]|uniref:UDP-glucose/GDP-mannose dehydrogenase N-terminal domain-containing protein n=1 Tax=Saccharopolyspora griseoalba TaxID=1431848 RepID=A0ABW2LEW4_9PSEU
MDNTFGRRAPHAGEHPVRCSCRNPQGGSCESTNTRRDLSAQRSRIEESFAMSTAKLRGKPFNSASEARPVERRRCDPASAAVIGLGYVGLPTALSLAAAGIPVTGADTDESRLLAINSQQVDLSETDRARSTEHSRQACCS